MQVIDTKSTAKGQIEVSYSHKVAGKKEVITVTALNRANADRKFWEALKKRYKAIKGK